MIALVAAVMLVGTVHAEGPMATSMMRGGDEILERVAEQFKGVTDYIVTLDVTPNIERMSIPPMRATMYFKKPDKVHFESKGFAVLPREGLSMNPAVLADQFRVEAVANDTLGGRSVLRLMLRPISDRARTRRVILHVDPDRWTVEKFSTTGIDGRAMSATFTHVLVDGYWLPGRLFVEFSAAEDTAATPQWEQGAPTRPGREAFRGGTIEVKYSEYRVNTGLGDDIFAEPAGRKD